MENKSKKFLKCVVATLNKTNVITVSCCTLLANFFDSSHKYLGTDKTSWTIRNGLNCGTIKIT